MNSSDPSSGGSGGPKPDPKPPQTAPSPDPSHKWLILGFGLSAAMFGMCLYSPSAAEQLLLGWIYFPIRVIPQVTVDWPAIVVGSVCIVAFVIGLHLTIRWFRRTIVPTTSLRAIPHRLRTTMLAAIGVLLVFASGTAMVGGTHQIVWIATGRARSSETNPPSAPIVTGAIRKAMTAGRTSQLRNNLKQSGLDLHNFHDAWNEFPPGGTIDENGRLLHGWAGFVAVSYGQFYYPSMDYSRPWNSSPNDVAFKCAIPFYLNPSVSEVFDSDGFGLNHFAGNVHVLPITRIDVASAARLGELLKNARGAADARIRNLPLRVSDITDGIANTLMIGESAGNYRPWGHPANVRDTALGLGKSINGFGGAPGQTGALFLMCDGTVKFISHTIDSNVFRALGTPAGGETIDLQSLDLK